MFEFALIRPIILTYGSSTETSFLYPNSSKELYTLKTFRSSRIISFPEGYIQFILKTNKFNTGLGYMASDLSFSTLLTPAVASYFNRKLGKRKNAKACSY